MAIIAYTGVPGSGKSYALIEQMLLPALAQGRRVLTNIDGVNPEACRNYAIDTLLVDDPGEVVLFKGEQAQKDGFWPKDEDDLATSFVQGGDLILFDEWRLYFPRRGRLPTAELEPFLRYHRHLVNSKGVACDVAIGTQLATDVHSDFRGLIERSFKFRKLKSVGMPKAYAWHAYEGHLQPKDGHYSKGNGTYRPEVFALYKSYAADGEGVESATDSRTSIFNKGIAWMVGGVVLMAAVGAYGAYSFFTDAKAFNPDAVEPVEGQPGQGGAVQASAAPVQSDWRIIGYFNGETGLRIVLGNRAGDFRMVDAVGFEFDGARPIKGTYQGQEVRSEDWLEAPASPSPYQQTEQGYAVPVPNPAVTGGYQPPVIAAPGATGY